MTLAREMALESEYVMGTFARKPVEFVEGHGMTLIDDAGNEYLDFLSGIGVCSLGHCHPSIVQAVSDQAAKLIHVSNYYYIEHRGEVAQLLSNMLNAFSGVPAASPSMASRRSSRSESVCTRARAMSSIMWR